MNSAKHEWPELQTYTTQLSESDFNKMNLTEETYIEQLCTFLEPQSPMIWQRGEQIRIGVGSAYKREFTGARRIEQAAAYWRQLSDAVDGLNLLAFGSFTFAESAVPSILNIPRFLISRTTEVFTLTTCWLNGEPEPQLEEMLQRGTPIHANNTDITFVNGAQSAETFQAAVSAAKKRILDGVCSKVVLARDICATVPQDLDARAPLLALIRSYPTCWVFALEGFFGASPETLIQTTGGVAHSRVLAGTAAKETSPAAQRRASTELLSSEKDRAEHDFALQSLLATLEPLSEEIRFDSEPFVLELPNLIHLASDVDAVLAPTVSALDVVAKLHPTAAVAGTPTDVACNLIAELETFDRGRYAGAIGWVDAAGDGEWAVALRCAQIEGTHITAWAGCGIMGDSSPAAELAESELKLAPIRRAMLSDR